jgi:DNA-binding NarL/FixJ family response regulator
MAIKVVIGCCNYLFGEGLKRLLRDERNINVIAIFDEGIDLEEIIKLNPDIILADFNIFCSLPEDFVIDSQKKILLISDRTLSIKNNRIPELISRGVVGILPPGTDSALFKKAVRAVSQGELWIERGIIKKIFASGSPSEEKVNLSRKEREIVSLVCKGYRNKEIASKLNISEQTVKSHCNRIYKKIGISDRLQLALYAYKMWPEYIPNVLRQK